MYTGAELPGHPSLVMPLGHPVDSWKCDACGGAGHQAFECPSVFTLPGVELCGYCGTPSPEHRPTCRVWEARAATRAKDICLFCGMVGPSHSPMLCPHAPAAPWGTEPPAEGPPPPRDWACPCGTRNPQIVVECRCGRGRWEPLDATPSSEALPREPPEAQKVYTTCVYCGDPHPDHPGRDCPMKPPNPNPNPVLGSKYPAFEDRGTSLGDGKLRPFGCCDSWPTCKCLKAKWSQGCQRCGALLEAGGCAARHKGWGWGHRDCAAGSRRLPPTTSAAPAGPPGDTERWTFDGIFAVWSEEYAPIGIYLSKDTVAARVRSGLAFPPTREVDHMAQAFDDLRDAIICFRRHLSTRTKVEVRW